MRRRSERKKSSDVSSPAPVSRRTSRRSHRVSTSETDKNAEETTTQLEENPLNEINEETNPVDLIEVQKDLVVPAESVRKNRQTRNRTPSNECLTPTKRFNQSETSAEFTTKVDVIPEEGENGGNVEILNNADGEEISSCETTKGDNETVEANTDVLKAEEEGEVGEEREPRAQQEQEDEKPQNCEEVTNVVSPSFNTNANEAEKLKPKDVLEIRTVDDHADSAIEQAGDVDDDHVGKVKESKTPQTRELEVKNVVSVEVEHVIEQKINNDDEQKENIEQKDANIIMDNNKDKFDENIIGVNDRNDFSTTITEAELKISNDAGYQPQQQQRTARKRKWITKKIGDRKAPILAISTDSLKNIISDVLPVPLSDVKLESSSEEEGILSDREDGEQTPTPEREIIVKTENKIVEKTLKRTESADNADKTTTTITAAAVQATHVQRSPSPARNRASHVLFITNLVRPFTVLQLKGLLARTGKIVEDGFWIDRIKSKCYVAYETEDEAIETRHALHGVRWPVSNPKCLNVDFGSMTDMARAVQYTKDEAPKQVGQVNKDAVVGAAWNRERDARDVDDKKFARPVREWDVGKKENLERDKTKINERRRSRSKERENSKNRENERNDKDRNQRHRSRGREQRSKTSSPVRKIKKENDPPLRLLDDLFRKTKTTPCIYWLPLTPEQIAEKEAFRQKRIEEHKERVKQRELERIKEREKERVRTTDRERGRGDRERDNRRNRSGDRDRRRSRSRDRRRY